VREILKQEPRYLAFIDQKVKPKTKTLNYLLPALSGDKLKAAAALLKPAPK
jgi:hypothetical protein